MNRIIGVVVSLIGLIGDCLDIIWWINLTAHWTEWKAANELGTNPDLTMLIFTITLLGIGSVIITITGFKMLK